MAPGRRPAKSGVLVVRTPPAPAPTAAPATSKGASTAPAPSGDVDSINIADLTLDVPLRPFQRKRRVPDRPFPFLELPSELRIKVYEHYFSDEEWPNEILDLGPDIYKRYHKKLGIIRVCRQIHDEATHYFYSTRRFRIFPSSPGRYFKTKKPLLSRMKKVQRECVTSLELRLGPGWGAPPRGWVVNDALGLAEFTNVRTLCVFVECDPSDGVFKGFRRSEGFYEEFSRTLLASLLEKLPCVNVVEFDGWSSVKKKGAMMSGLLETARTAGYLTAWGPERGWTDEDHEDDEPNKHEPNPFMAVTPLTTSDWPHNILVSA